MRSFNSYTIEQLESFINNLSLNRQITQVHIHHTWRPTKEQYNQAEDKERIILGMYNYHTRERGWSDIAQHFTVSPDGLIWDGRSLDIDPASILGMNRGAIAIEMIGDFDIGRESLVEPQLSSVTILTALLLKKFNLGLDSIIFHREGSTKTCPGSSIDKDWFINKVEEVSNMSDENNINPINEEWKYEGIDYLYKNNLLNSSDRWKDQINNPMPVWAVTLLLMRIHKDLKRL